MPGEFPPVLRPQRHPPASFNPSTYRNSITSHGTVADEKRSLDFTQRIEKKLAEYNASTNIFKRWLLEIVSWTTSALCMGAIVGIYFRVDGNLMTKNELALNSANVLGKVAAAMLIVPTSEAIGQLKWNWFHSSKAMWDFEIFDKASRGPWGAALLLYRTKGRSLAALGALLIVLLLAIDTFFQQVVEYRDLWSLESATGSIPRNTRYEPYYKNAWMNNDEMLIMDRSFEPLIKQFFYENGTQPTAFGNGTRPDIPLSCPTSNCTWPTYNTLAVCSRCTEASALLDISYACLDTPNDWTATWLGPRFKVPYPNETACGYFLNATSDSPTLLSGYVDRSNGSSNGSDEALLVRAVSLTDFDLKQPYYGNGSVAFKDFRYPLMDFLIASASDGVESIFRKEPPVVHELLSEYFEPIQEDDSWPWLAWTLYDGVDVVGTWIEYTVNITLEPHVSELSGERFEYPKIAYGCDNYTVTNILNIFDDFFPSFYTTKSATDTPLLRFKNYYEGPWTQTLDFHAWQAPNNVTRFVERLATSMTNLLRSSASKEMIEGSAYSKRSFIHIAWAWLTFPFALLLLSLAFLVSTMWETSKDSATGVWKTSAMPTLLYGLPEDTRGRFTQTLSSLKNDAKKVRIKLLPNSGWRVSKQSLLRSPLLPVRKNQPPPGWI
ncbi:hypothetical protein C7974DRAFT_310154 [Boeremia exigua]|uniref:uncharacterized protein n=1 Tax=Boeremia exigua TaxID=749465 RepID=UPI001E8DF46D|nr:uncharacterized protein C7974DRAFT_310154 [Boeremia exigua]KAH6632989.1 hypothetical protein C7974DRAFT_310154 [Boeremia exigua]